MARVFVACDLPASVRDELALSQCGIPRARWLAPEMLHVTLTFIGDVDGGELDQIVDALGAVNHSPFFVRLAGCGVFPPSGAPRVLWAGLDPTAELAELKRKIDRTLDRLGTAFERRKYHPHVTLARLAHRPDTLAIGSYVVQHNTYSTSSFEIDEFVLYESILSPRGARYYRRAVFRLA